jgi:hypothetical protein
MSDTHLVALVGLVLLAPGALVLLVALLRGYSVTVILERRRRPGRGDER